MRILLLNNNFTGAYGSQEIFLQEIYHSLRLEGFEVFISESVEESIKYLRHKGIDLSIGMGQYLQYIGKKPLYELFKTPHYQWIIDNPCKVGYDKQSQFIKYLIIDREFELLMSSAVHKTFFASLGVPEENNSAIDMKNKKDGLVFSGQIRNSFDLKQAITCHKEKKRLVRITESLMERLDNSFIQIFCNETKDVDDILRQKLFPILNSFFRAYKREYVISHITEYPVTIIGDVQNKQILAQKNITCLGAMPYQTAARKISEYKYALDVEPNFKSGVHDRVARTALNGTLPIANHSQYLQDLFGENILFYCYADIADIENKILNCDPESFECRIENMQKIIVENFSWSALLKHIINDFNKTFRI